MNKGKVFTHSYDAGRRVEILCTWFLRFNGYLTTPHFVLHRPDGTEYTEADILGVRFPNSREEVVIGGPDPALEVREDLIDCIVGECSAKGAKLNLQWQENLEHHLAYVLRYVGIWPEPCLRGICEGLAKSGCFTTEWEENGQKYRVRFVFFSRATGHPKYLKAARRLTLHAC